MFSLTTKLHKYFTQFIKPAFHQIQHPHQLLYQPNRIIHFINQLNQKNI